jgi:hypothetical protein
MVVSSFNIEPQEARIMCLTDMTFKSEVMCQGMYCQVEECVLLKPVTAFSLCLWGGGACTVYIPLHVNSSKRLDNSMIKAHSSYHSLDKFDFDDQWISNGGHPTSPE